MTASREYLRTLLELSFEDRESELRRLSAEERKALRYYWRLWARESQLPPPGDWQTWLICAGRGFGKTRAGAEWVRRYAQHNADTRIALVAASLVEARAIMVEGESGIMAVCPPENYPLFEPSLRRISWGNGAQAFLYSAAEADSLRGPQHHIACRAGTKGILRLRKPRADRYPASPGCRRRRKRTSRSALARRLLDSGEPGQRRMGGTRRLPCKLGRYPVDPVPAVRRHAGLRPVERQAPSLSLGMATGSAPGIARGRIECRCRGPCQHRSDHRHTCNTGHISVKLTGTPFLRRRSPITEWA